MVSQTETILSVKKLIEAVEGVKVPFQQLYVENGEKQLSNKSMVLDMGEESKFILFLVEAGNAILTATPTRLYLCILLQRGWL